MSEVVPLTNLKSSCSPAKILAVSKLQSPEKIRFLYQQGQREFGENYVQELTEKFSTLQDLQDIRWHFIGSLQKNKIKYIIGKVNLIHSVGTLDLAQAISKQAEKNQVTQNILIQVNLTHELTKNGFDKAELIQCWDQLVSLKNINICGLMTMPPLSENPEAVRPYFKELKDFLGQLKLTTPSHHSLNELSMGTSSDYVVAIQEGATIVRLGTILFGERQTTR